MDARSYEAASRKRIAPPDFPPVPQTAITVRTASVSLSRSAWTAPVSNDLVSVGFKQHIAAGDALRTGGYSRTLTFTPSTTVP